MRIYPVTRANGAVVPIVVEHTYTLGLKAILVHEQDHILGYTARVNPQRYGFLPTVVLGDQEIDLPLTTQRMEAIVDIVRYLDDIDDTRLKPHARKVAAREKSRGTQDETTVEV